MGAEVASFLLRRWQATDAASLAKHANNRRIWLNLRNAFPHPYTLENAHEWLANTFEHADIFAIEVGGEAVGGIGLHFFEDIHQRNAEIGYWLSETHWGRGIATAAVRQVVDYCFEEYLHIYRIFAMPFGHNVVSQRVLQKAGFRHEATLKEAAFKDGRAVDEAVFALLRSEWETGLSN